MTNPVNLSSSVPPVPIPPVAPNFLFCSGDYGSDLIRDEAMIAGSLLQQGTRPVTYSFKAPDIDSHVANISVPDPGYHLPILEDYRGVLISVDVAGPVEINEFRVAPNDIRGMVAYVANECLGRQGTGGFITSNIRGLVDYVTNPASDIEAELYPDNTAFLTATVSSINSLHASPGDYDPQMPRFLWKTELDVFHRMVEPYQREVIAGRILLFKRAEKRMRSGEPEMAWWEEWALQGNRTVVSNLQLSNVTTKSATTARRRKRVAGLLRGRSSVSG